MRSVKINNQYGPGVPTNDNIHSKEITTKRAKSDVRVAGALKKQ
jgi:hypothetical protein